MLATAGDSMMTLHASADGPPPAFRPQPVHASAPSRLLRSAALPPEPRMSAAAEPAVCWLILNGKSAGDDAVREAVAEMRCRGVRLAVRVTWESGDAARWVADAIEAGAYPQWELGVQVFEDTLDEVVTLALFIPLITGTGGNSGAQASTAVIRAMAHRVMVMKGGEVIETGLTDQVLDDPHEPYTQLLVSSILPA